MITLQRNPYTWDKSNIGKILSPITTSIQYLSDGKELPVKNLSLGDEVVYEVPTPGTPLVSCYDIYKYISPFSIQKKALHHFCYKCRFSCNQLVSIGYQLYHTEISLYLDILNSIAWLQKSVAITTLSISLQ